MKEPEQSYSEMSGALRDRRGCHRGRQGALATFPEVVASKPGRTRPELSEHAARLARLRAELVREGKAINRRGGVNRTGAKLRGSLRGSLPTCCIVGCLNPRVPPAEHCVSCESELEEGE